MTTITIPDWFLYIVTGVILLSAIADGLKIYATYLERKLRKLKNKYKESRESSSVRAWWEEP